MKITILEKEYNLPDRLGDLPYKRFMQLQKLHKEMIELNKDDSDMVLDFNVKYLSIMLDERVEIIEMFPFNQFMELLKHVNETSVEL